MRRARHRRAPAVPRRGRLVAHPIHGRLHGPAERSRTHPWRRPRGARRHHGLQRHRRRSRQRGAHPVPAGAPRRPQLVHHRVRGRGDAGHLRGVQRRADPPFHRVLPRDVHDLAAAYHVPAPSAVPHHRPVRSQLGAARAKRGRSHHEAHHPSHLRQVPQRGAQLRLGTVGKRRRQQPEDHTGHVRGRFAPAGERGAADEARGDEGGGRGRQRGARRRSGRGPVPVAVGDAGLLRPARPDRRGVHARRLAAPRATS